MLFLAHTWLTPQTLWHAWNWAPTLLLALLLPTLLYLCGVRNLWQQAGQGHGVRYWQVVSFLGGILAIGIALISPLDALSDMLFSAHMLQHLLLLLVAPMLFVLSRPLPTLLWAFPRSLRRSVGRELHRKSVRQSWHLLTWPPLVWSLNALVLWLWHLPLFYQAALENESIHVMEHLSFLVVAALFWWVVFYPHGGRRRYGMSLLYIFLTALQGGVLGALLTFSSALWYPLYAPSVRVWGITPLADQQLAGLIMWIPSGILYLGVAALLFIIWLGVLEQGMRQRQRVQILSTAQVSATPGPFAVSVVHGLSEGGGKP